MTVTAWMGYKVTEQETLREIAERVGYGTIIDTWRELDAALWEQVQDIAELPPLIPTEAAMRLRGPVAGMALLTAIVEQANSIGGLLTVAGLNPTADLFDGIPATIQSALAAIRALEANKEMQLFPDFDSWAADQRSRINLIITEDARAHEQQQSGRGN